MGRFKHILGILFVTLYLCHYTANNFFIHTHHFNWGTVTHSHPYLPAEGSSEHQHSAAQLHFISNVNQQSYFLSDVPAVPPIFFILLYTILICKTAQRKELFHIALKGRSPPAC